jgi:hypothetical protein
LRFQCLASKVPRLLFAHDLDYQSLGSAAVKFGVEDFLPWAEIECPGRDGHYHLVMDKQVLKVRVAVVLTRAVVAIITAVGHEVRSDLAGWSLPRGWSQLV